MADDDPQNDDDLAQTSRWVFIGVFAVLFLVIVTPFIRHQLSLLNTNADKKAPGPNNEPSLDEEGLDKSHTFSL